MEQNPGITSHDSVLVSPKTLGVVAGIRGGSRSVGFDDSIILDARDITEVDSPGSSIGPPTRCHTIFL